MKSNKILLCIGYQSQSRDYDKTRPGDLVMRDNLTILEQF